MNKIFDTALPWIIAAVFLLVLAIGAASQPKAIGLQENKAFNQLQTFVNKKLSEALSVHADFFYRQGYKAGYLQAAVDCGEVQRGLKKQKVSK